ncbi:MAG: FkbM family methyltransferase [Candidatus Aminicenantes bacterium]
MPEGRHIFIDGGSHQGQTIRAFEKSSLFSDYDWDIYAFECNPLLAERLRSRYSKRDDVIIIEKAMWIHNQGLEFYFGKTDLGGNVVKNRYTAQKKKSIHVESVDFGDWLKDNFDIEDTVFIKFDIEGAEYAILDKMFRDRSIRLVDHLYLELHSAIMDNFTEKTDKELIEKLERAGIAVEIKESGSKEGDYFSR